MNGCAEAAVLGHPDDIKGESIWAFCVPSHNRSLSLADFKQNLKALVRNKIGGFAVPSEFILVDELPKTRSGKIMRRVLRKLVCGDNNLGDTSTLNNPALIDEIKKKITEQHLTNKI